MDKQEAVEKIKANPTMVEHCGKWGGVLMFDKNKGGIYFCNEDGKTYYERWLEKEGRFDLFEWRCSGLNGLDLEIVYDDEIGLVT